MTPASSPAVYFASRVRARPLAPEDRREAILDAVIPLLRQRGREVSTRELAAAAGLAEGTLFRAFGDKESLVRAAVERYFDPEPFRGRLRGIDPEDPVEERLRQVLGILRERFEGVVGFMSALGMDRRPPFQPSEDGNEEWIAILGRIFRPDELAVPVETAAHYLRLVALGAAIPPLTRFHEFDHEELLTLIGHGVLRGGAR